MIVRTQSGFLACIHLIHAILPEIQHQDNQHKVEIYPRIADKINANTFQDFLGMNLKKQKQKRTQTEFSLR